MAEDHDKFDPPVDWSPEREADEAALDAAMEECRVEVRKFVDIVKAMAAEMNRLNNV